MPLGEKKPLKNFVTDYFIQSLRRKFRATAFAETVHSYLGHQQTA